MRAHFGLPSVKAGSQPISSIQFNLKSGNRDRHGQASTYHCQIRDSLFHSVRDSSAVPQDRGEEWISSSPMGPLHHTERRRLQVSAFGRLVVHDPDRGFQSSYCIREGGRLVNALVGKSAKTHCRFHQLDLREIIYWSLLHWRSCCTPLRIDMLQIALVHSLCSFQNLSRHWRTTDLWLEVLLLRCELPSCQVGPS
jgi:hypothetical protein